MSTSPSVAPPTAVPRRAIGKRLAAVIVVALAAAAAASVIFGYPGLAPILVGLPAAYKAITDTMNLDRARVAETPGISLARYRLPPRLQISLALVLVYGLGYFTPSIAAALTRTSAWVEISDTRVSSSETVALHWRAVNTGWRPALFLYSPADNLFYPSLCGAASPAGTQACTVAIGTGADRGKRFELRPALLNRAAEAAIKRYKADPTSAGLSDLPDGVSLFKGVVVFRKD